MSEGNLSQDWSLELRDGLPDALRVLLKEFPRNHWAEDPGFQGLISFWLERHMMFRRIMERLKSDAMSCKEGQIEGEVYANRLARLGSTFVSELHGHHGIEDAHYFPVLAKMDERIAKGFDLLDQDHHALDGHLNRFVESANAVLKPRDERSGDLGHFIEQLDGLERFLDRHLIDEEELVVPVVLKYGAAGLG